MDKKKEVIKNTIIIFLGKISTQFLSFLLLPLYTAKLTTADYGLVDLIITYITLFVPIITLQQEMALFRFLVDSRYDEKNKKVIISTTLNTILKIVIIFAIVSLLCVQFVSIGYKYWIIINVIVVVFSNLFLQISRGFGNNIKFSVASFLVGAISIIMNLLLILGFKFGAEAILISSSIGNLIGIIYLFLTLKIYNYISFKNFSKSVKKKLLKYSVPLIPNGISWWILNVSDRTIISFFLGVSYNGIYSVANKFPNIINGFFSIFGLSWTESASLHINDHDSEEFFSDIFNNTFKIFSCLCLSLIAIMPLIFKIMVNNNYNESYIYIPILIISTFLSCISSIYGGIYIAKKMTKQIAYTSVISALINVIVHLILINIIGLYAAAISTLVSYLFLTLYRAYDIKKIIRIRYKYSIFLNFIFFSIIELYFYYLNNTIYNILFLIFIVLISIGINYPLIKKLIKNIYNKIRSCKI